MSTAGEPVFDIAQEVITSPAGHRRFRATVTVSTTPGLFYRFFGGTAKAAHARARAFVADVAMSAAAPTLAELDRAIGAVVVVIDSHGEAYMPILRRLLEERDRLTFDQSMIERARRIAKGEE